MEVMKFLAIQHAARTRRQSDQLARVYFKDTLVSYRDDNRHQRPPSKQATRKILSQDPSSRQAGGAQPAATPLPGMGRYQSDLQARLGGVYEALHPSGDASHIDALLTRHAGLARQLQQLLLLKPQNRVRIRYQEEGSDLDLDVALRSLIDWRAGPSRTLAS